MAVTSKQISQRALLSTAWQIIRVRNLQLACMEQGKQGPFIVGADDFIIAMDLVGHVSGRKISPLNLISSSDYKNPDLCYFFGSGLP